MNYYTIVVTLCDKEVLTYKNLSVDQCKDFQAKVWTQGVKKVLTGSAMELVSPFLISKVIIKEQVGEEPT